MKNIYISLLSVIFVNFFVSAIPKRVVILRHGEKYTTSINLTPKGELRAKRLAEYFSKLPDVIYNQKPYAILGITPHTMVTMAPTAKLFKLPIVSFFSFTKNKQEIKEYSKLAAKILREDPIYDNKVIIACWEHRELPVLARTLGAKQAPSNWPGKQFDHFWIIDFNPDGTVKNFEDICHKSLDTDCEQNIK